MIYMTRPDEVDLTIIHWWRLHPSINKDEDDIVRAVVEGRYWEREQGPLRFCIPFTCALLKAPLKCCEPQIRQNFYGKISLKLYHNNYERGCHLRQTSSKISPQKCEDKY